MSLQQAPILSALFLTLLTLTLRPPPLRWPVPTLEEEEVQEVQQTAGSRTLIPLWIHACLTFVTSFLNQLFIIGSASSLERKSRKSLSSCFVSSRGQDRCQKQQREAQTKLEFWGVGGPGPSRSSASGTCGPAVLFLLGPVLPPGGWVQLGPVRMFCPNRRLEINKRYF